MRLGYVARLVPNLFVFQPVVRDSDQAVIELLISVCHSVTAQEIAQRVHIA